MTNNDASVWGLHTGRPRGHSREIHQRLELQTDKLFKQGYVALGWPQLGDLGALAADRETFKQQYRAVYGQDAPARSMGTDVSKLFQFVYGLQEGDVIVWRSPVDHLLHIGVVTGPYLHQPTLVDPIYDQRRPCQMRDFEASHRLPQRFKEGVVAAGPSTEPSRGSYRSRASSVR